MDDAKPNAGVQNCRVLLDPRLAVAARAAERARVNLDLRRRFDFDRAIGRPAALQARETLAIARELGVKARLSPALLPRRELFRHRAYATACEP